jgi:hypothetical protein
MNSSLPEGRAPSASDPIYSDYIPTDVENVAFLIVRGQDDLIKSIRLRRGQSQESVVDVARSNELGFELLTSRQRDHSRAQNHVALVRAFNNDRAGATSELKIVRADAQFDMFASNDRVIFRAIAFFSHVPIVAVSFSGRNSASRSFGSR